VSQNDGSGNRQPLVRQPREANREFDCSTSKRSAAAEPMHQDAPDSAAAFRSRMRGLTLTEGRVPALAIAAFVRENGAVYSGEILDRFFLSETTLRRRRPTLARLGIRFLENGRGSVYATAELARQLPSTSPPK
jgi:hypothetical protein